MEIIKEVFHYFLDEKIINITPISAGHINSTWAIETTSQSYLLQKINTFVFSQYNSMISNHHKVVEYLKTKSNNTYTLPPILPTKKNTLYHLQGSEVWRLTPFVPNSISYNQTTNPKIAQEAGKLIGWFHSHIKDFSEDISIHLPHFHDLPVRVEQYQKALKNTKRKTTDEIQFCIQNIEKKLDLLSDYQKVSFPTQITHADTKLNNLLFDKNTHQAIALIDLDTLMPNSVLTDIGDTIRTLCNPVYEDQNNWEDIEFNLPFFSLFLKGYLLENPHISDIEKKHISEAILHLPLIMAIRMFTDYLSGNKYYQVSYENQNLDRATHQLIFCQKVVDNRIEIQSIIKNLVKDGDQIN